MTDSAVFHDSVGNTYRDASGPLVIGGGAVASVFGRTGAVVAVTGDYAGIVSAFLSGATSASRYVGATTTGAPASGTFATGDFVVAQDGHIFVCTAGGTPGTWADVSAGAAVGYATPSIVLGSSAAAGAAATVIRSDATIAAFDATNPSTQAFGDAAAVGTAAFAARRDHKHAMPVPKIPTAFYRRTAGDYFLANNSTFAALDATNLNLTLAALAGDILEIVITSRWGNETVNGFLDAATIVSASPVNYVSGGTGSAANFGVAGWVGLSGFNNTMGGSVFYAVQSGDISGGNVTVRVMYRTGALGAAPNNGKTLRAGTASLDALFFAVKNLGQ